MMRLHRAMIYVKDVSAMAAFYADVIGLKPIEETRQDIFIEFETDGVCTFALHRVANPEKFEPLAMSPREENPIKLGFEVEDVESECRRLRSLGVQILKRGWGGYDGVDPEGNIFGLSQR